jgi:hypothetical protein
MIFFLGAPRTGDYFLRVGLSTAWRPSRRAVSFIRLLQR